MNRVRLRSVVVVGLLALAGLPLLSAPASAAPSIGLQPSSGPVGTPVTVTGGGFLPGYTCQVRFGGTLATPCSVTPNGTIAASFTVPARPPGTYTVRVCNNCDDGDLEEAAERPFVLTATTTVPPTVPGTTAPGTPTTRPLVTLPPNTLPRVTVPTLPTTTTTPDGATTTTTVPAGVAPQIQIDPELLRGITGSGIGLGRYGLSTVLRFPGGQPEIPVDGFRPRCAPTDGAEVIDFDDLEPGTDAAEAYADLGVHLAADNHRHRVVDGVRTSVRSETAERVEVFAPEPGTISSPNGVRWVEPDRKQHADNLLEIRFDTPQRTVGLYVGQVGEGLHGHVRMFTGRIEDQPGQNPTAASHVGGFDEVWVDAPSALTTCMLVTRPEPFDTITILAHNYPVPEIDRLFFSEEALEAPAPSLVPANAQVTIASPSGGRGYDAAVVHDVTGSVILRPPLGGFEPGARLVDEIRVTWIDADGRSYVTREAEVDETPRLDRGLVAFRYRVTGVMLPPGVHPISAVAVGPGYSAGAMREIETTGPPVRPISEDAGLLDFQPIGMEVTQGLLGPIEVGRPGGTRADGVVHVAHRDTVVRLYGRIDYPTDPDGEDVRRRPVPVAAHLIGMSRGRALPGSPIVARTSTIELEPGERTDEALAAMRLDGTASWNFVLPDSWTAAGRVSLIAVINPLDHPTHLEEAPRTGGFANLQAGAVEFTDIAPRPVHFVFADARWRDEDGTTHRAAPSLSEVAAVWDHLYRVMPLPRDGVPIGGAMSYPMQFATCTPEMGEDAICQEPPALSSPPIWDNAVLQAAHPEVIDQHGRAFIPMLFSPASPIGCSGRAGIGQPPLFHAGACRTTVAQEAAHTLGLDHLSNAHGELRGGGFHDRYDGDHGEVDADAVGWDVLSGQPVAPTLPDGSHRHDFMSYGGPDDVSQWASLETWNLLGAALRRFDEGAGVPPGSAPQLVAAAQPVDPSVPALLVSAVVAEGRAELATVPVDGAPAGEPLGAGDLRIELLDAGGERLLVQGFAPVGESTHFEDLRLVEEVAVFDGAAALVLAGPDGELGRIEAGPAAPAVDEFTAAVADGDDGEVVVGWSGSDPDAGDDVSVFVQVRARGSVGPWALAAGPLPATGEDLSLPGLAGAAGPVEARLVASDGLRWTASGPIALDLPGPALEVAILGLGDSGLVTDPSDVELGSLVVGGPADVEWFVDGEALSVGEAQWLPDLVPGEHEVEVVATRVDGTTATATRALLVDEDADGDGLGDAWEDEHGLDPADPSDGGSDDDVDQLLAWEEQALGSDPREVDTDGDRYADGIELVGGSDPDDAESVPVRLHGDPTAGIPRLDGEADDGSGSPPWALVAVGVAALAAAGGATFALRRRRGMAA